MNRKAWYYYLHLRIKGILYLCLIITYIIIISLLTYISSIKIAVSLKFLGLAVVLAFIIIIFVFMFGALVWQDPTVFTEMTKIFAQIFFLIFGFYVLYVLIFKICLCPFGDDPFEDYIIYNPFIEVKYLWHKDWDVYHTHLELCCKKYNIPYSELDDNRTFITDKTITNAFRMERPMRYIEDCVNLRSQQYHSLLKTEELEQLKNIKK